LDQVALGKAGNVLAPRSRYWKLDRLIDAMIVDNGSSSTVMNFGEFETGISKKGPFKDSFENVKDIFVSFEFTSRPVLGRLLLTYACMLHTLMLVYASPTERLDEVVSGFVDSKKSDPLRWWSNGNSDVLKVVRPYVLKRLNQATLGGYATF
jgi:hypothetical protein